SKDITGSLNWLSIFQGRLSSPLSRTQPAATQLMASFHQPNYRISLILHRNEAQRKLSFGDQQDQQRIPPGVLMAFKLPI
ncbi:MAG: hypothetical protein ACOH5I_25185, partial [Oligoflexus sp.]